MSVFNLDKISLDGKDDIQKVQKYLRKLDEQLDYMFNNITPEDNYSKNALVRHIQQGDKIAEIAVAVDGITLRVISSENRISEIVTDVDGIRLNMVNKGNIISTINVSNEGVAIKGEKIRLEGTVTANNHFVIRTDGTMQCKNAVINGTLESAEIRGGSIYGDLEVQCGLFFIHNPNQDNARDFRLGISNFEFDYDSDSRSTVFRSTWFGHHSNPLKIFPDGNITCHDIKFDNSAYDGFIQDPERWTLLAMLKDLYDKYEA